MLIKWFKKHFVSRKEFLKYMLANNDLMDIQNRQIMKLSSEKNDYKTFTEQLDKLTKK